MADFAIHPAAFNGAFCTVDTFRHLLNENAAINHLRCVARHLKKQGVYVLGLHLLPDGGADNQFARWQHVRGRLSVTTTMRVLNIDRRRREETIQMSLKIKTPRRNADYQSVYKLRTYTLRQFHQLLTRAGVFRIRACYDQDYDLTQAQTPDADSEDIVFLLEKTA